MVEKRNINPREIIAYRFRIGLQKGEMGKGIELNHLISFLPSFLPPSPLRQRTVEFTEKFQEADVRDLTSKIDCLRLRLLSLRLFVI